MEPRAGMGVFDSDSGIFQLYACTQGATGMRGQMSTVLGVPPEKIRVIAEEVGGGFGVRFNIYPEYCALLLAANRLGRPGTWVGTRPEGFTADEQPRDIVDPGEMA